MFHESRQLSPESRTRLQSNLENVHRRIAAAAARSGRPATAIRLVAVTKYVGLPTIRALLEQGLIDFGESRVQQLQARARALGADIESHWPAASQSATPRWHLIGSLQRNKVRAALAVAGVIHSVDSVRLAETIDRIAAEIGRRIPVFIEVNIAGEDSKAGIPIQEFQPLLLAMKPMSNLELLGLMTMAPLAATPDTARPHFARLRELARQARTSGQFQGASVELSMGMSSDFEAAIEEGATVVRVGSALFAGVTDPEGINPFP